uniref:DegV domain-containing protein n=1 Tax=Thermosporothrix sp. COM3 TaxID=2490863 RepID=A0A455SSA4_9CHLR|nr:DegV domain-containing protein [Thermosporothrix sp. COM3]
MPVRIVTDSTADIPAEQAQVLGITVVPLTVFFGEESYLDGAELDTATFYQKLQEAPDLPRTSQPSPARFAEAYTRLIQEGADGIISVHLSSGLSGTYQSACTARDSLPEELRQVPIEIIDSRSISAGMSLAILKAAREAQEGHSLDEIKSALLDRLSRSRVLAILDTLEYLKRGGRIGAAKAFLGNMLSFKPIVTVKEGVVAPLEQPRTRSKAYVRAAQLASEFAPFEDIAIVEANDEVGQQLEATLRTIYQGEITHYKFGAVLGTHTGPGLVGVAFISQRQLD